MNIFYSKPKGVAPLIIIGIIAILIIGGVIFVHTKSKKAQEENQPLRLENPKTTSITETRILEDCEKIKEQYQKDYCYSDLAYSKQDSSICDRIEDQDTKDNCYWNVARAKHDSSICKEIKDQPRKDGCYSDVANAERNSSICEKIEDQDEKESCGHYVDEAIFFDKPNN